MNRIIIYILTILTLFGTFCVGIFSSITLMIALGFIALFTWGCVQFGRTAILTNVMLLVISSGLTVIIVELILRATFQTYLYYRPHEMIIQRWPRLPVITRYRANAFIERETFGDLAAMYGDKHFKEKRNIVFITDSFGFRNRPSNKDTVYDILVLGDSFATGNGTTQERTWVSLLGSRNNLKIYNLAIPGSPWDSYINLAMEINRLKIKPGTTIILAMFTGNDLDERYGTSTKITDLSLNNTLDAAKVSLSTYRRRSVLRILKDRLFGSNNSSDRVLVKKFLNERKILFYKSYVKRKDRSKQDIIEHENYLHLVQTLNAIKNISHMHSVTFKIILIPTKAEIYSWIIDDANPWSTNAEPSGFSAVLKEFCQNNEIDFLDLKPFLLSSAKIVFESSNLILYWYDDTHWNAKGNDIVADIVYENFIR